MVLLSQVERDLRTRFLGCPTGIFASEGNAPAPVLFHFPPSTAGTKTGDKEKGVGGRWTDVLKKQGDKWVLIADHGGATPSKD